MEPAEYALLHGDAHGGNTLKELAGEDFKLIDPDGIIYEKAYDLGVLMREWVDEYEQEPLKEGKERCWYLHTLTGVSEKAIWEWGYLQTVSTAFVLLQIGQAKTGRKMLRVAECWAAEAEDAELEYRNKLIHFLSCEYGFQVTAIRPAQRGFYGETWDILTESGRCFLKVDYWNHHKESYRNSLSVVQYMADSGISFVPKIIKTKSGHLYGSFCQGTAAAFEYVPGELLENCPTEQLYRRLAEIYRLKTDGIELQTETFGTEQIDTFHRLKNLPGLSADVKKALSEKDPAIARYAERLRAFAAVCKGGKENFHITHGDAGSNCILNEKQLFLVDWDTVMLAPIERDAWIFICDKEQLEIVNLILAENEIDYRLEQNRLCYYCYQFFFYYLNEYMKSIASAENEEQKAKIIRDLIAYLDDSWIYKRLETADKTIFLRRYRQEDGILLAKLFYETVHSINIRDYTEEQVSAWATGKIDLEKWDHSFQEHYSIVAVDNDVIAGFGDIDQSGYLDRLFVHKDYQGRGIATAICDNLEQDVQGEIVVHASITARPFFEKRGYKVMKKQQVIRQGIFLTNYVMKKRR